MGRFTNGKVGPLPSGGPTTYKEDGVFDRPPPFGRANDL
jgi:hypothetical protein